MSTRISWKAEGNEMITNLSANSCTLNRMSVGIHVNNSIINGWMRIDIAYDVQHYRSSERRVNPNE